MKTFVIKIGGSIISPSEELPLNLSRLEEFKNILKPFIDSGNKFILTTGAGHLARKYQKILKNENYSEYDQHYIGAAICNVNAIVVRAVFSDLAEEKIVAFSDFEDLDKIKFEQSVLIVGAAKPGPSSDWDAALMAKHFGASVVISLKDVGGVYDADPDIHPNAVKFKNISWDKYLEVIGKETHSPGDNLPVDPLASKFAKDNGIKFLILNGKDDESFRNAIGGMDFDGTVIS